MGEEGIEEGQLGMSMWMLDGYAEVIAAISSECSSEWGKMRHCVHLEGGISSTSCWPSTAPPTVGHRPVRPQVRPRNQLLGRRPVCSAAQATNQSLGPWSVFWSRVTSSTLFFFVCVCGVGGCEHVRSSTEELWTPVCHQAVNPKGRGSAEDNLTGPHGWTKRSKRDPRPNPRCSREE